MEEESDEHREAMPVPTLPRPRAKSSVDHHRQFRLGVATLLLGKVLSLTGCAAPDNLAPAKASSLPDLRGVIAMPVSKEKPLPLPESMSWKEYSQMLIDRLTSPELLAAFFKEHWEYVSDEDPDAAPEHRGVKSMFGDPWQSPEDTLQRRSKKSKGKSMGDCEDLAFLATAVLRAQGKLAFTVKFETHAVCLWAEQKGDEWIVYSQDTNGMKIGRGKTLNDACDDWWNSYGPPTSCHLMNPSPKLFEVLILTSKLGISKPYPREILQYPELLAVIGYLEGLIDMGQGRECALLISRLPLKIKEIPYLQELEKQAKALFFYHR